MEKDIVICPNCGAKISVMDPRCPFCGHINETGAEHKFMNDMNRTREEMEKLPEQQAGEIKKEIKKSTKIILAVALISLVAAGAVFLAAAVLKNVSDAGYRDYNSAENAKLSKVWEMEKFPLMDQMYQEKDFEGLDQFIFDCISDDDPVNDCVFEWRHIDFFNGRDRYRNILHEEEILNSGRNMSRNAFESFFFDVVWFYLREYDTDYGRLTDEELGIFDEEYRVKAEEILKNSMHLSDDELTKLHEQVCKKFDNGDEYLNYKKCRKYAKKIYKRIG